MTQRTDVLAEPIHVYMRWGRFSLTKKRITHQICLICLDRFHVLDNYILNKVTRSLQVLLGNDNKPGRKAPGKEFTHDNVEHRLDASNDTCNLYAPVLLL